MRLVLALGLIGALATFAAAGEVEDRQASIQRAEREQGQLLSNQRQLLAQQQRKVAEVERYRKSRAWSAKEKRENAQAEAQELGKRLEQGQAKIRAVEARVLAERRSLVAAIDRELAARPTDARRRQLERLHASEQQKLPVPVKKLKVPDERVDPLDDPEDLDEKAARLKKSEDELVRELQKVETRATHLKRQAQMAKANSRSKDEVFVDTQKGRRSGTTHAEADRAGAANDGAPEGPASGGGSTPPASPSNEDSGFTGSGGATAADPDTTVSPSASGGVDLVTQFSEVVDQSTIDALRSAERSSDPAVRARAAERLAVALRARAEKVKQQRQAIERRAKQLRGH